MKHSPEVERALKAAGWSEQRDLRHKVQEWRRDLETSDPNGFRMSAAAEQALREFGGLSFVQSGPGVEVPREPFETDPMLAVGENDRFGAHSRVLAAPLFPIGEAGTGHVFLGITPDGAVFAFMEDLWRVGDTFADALETLIRGRRPQLIARSVPWDP